MPPFFYRQASEQEKKIEKCQNEMTLYYQMYLTDFYRVFHTTPEYTISSVTHGSISWLDLIYSKQKVNLRERESQRENGNVHINNGMLHNYKEK